MRNKILIIDAKEKDREELEQILSEIVAKGGELFFASNLADGLKILNNEHPQIVLLDDSFEIDKEEWKREGTHVLVMSVKKRHESEENFVSKPFKTNEILKKCAHFLENKVASRIPPM